MSTNEHFVSADEDRTRDIQQFAQGLLKGLRFRGTFIAKRYVPTIKQYRSVILINDDEKPLIRILMEIKKRINATLGDNNPFFWTGFTKSSDQFFLWVNLTDEILGEYLFHIRAFEIDGTEAKVRLRQVQINETTAKPTTSFNTIGSNFMDDTIKPIVQDFASDLGLNLRSALTFANFKEASSFLIVAFVACVTAAFYTTRYLLEFFLRFAREFSLVVKSVTPALLSIIDLVRYIIFGFYAVVMTLVRPTPGMPTDKQFSNQQRSLQYYNIANGPAARRAIQYKKNYRNVYGQRYPGVTITELED